MAIPLTGLEPLLAVTAYGIGNSRIGWLKVGKPIFGEQDSFVVIGQEHSVFADEKGQYHAWTVDEAMTTHKRPVEIGELSGDSVRILKGLNAGETILTAGVQYVQEGTKVRPLEANAAKEPGE